LAGILVANIVALWVLSLGALVVSFTALKERRTYDAKQSLTFGKVRGPDVGKPAPEIQGKSRSGQPTRLSEYLGTPLLVMFVSPGCGACTKAIPDILEAATATTRVGGRSLIVSTGSAEATEDQYHELLSCPAVEGVITDVGTDLLSETYRLPTPAYCAVDRSGVVLATGVSWPGDAVWPHPERALSHA
jgi:peroxiredoxin